MRTSLIVPVYNEVENLPILAEQLQTLMNSLDGDSETVFVNDGSNDGSTAVYLNS
ncbi:MAG: glycosyltransferase [Pirellulales bacterium]